MAVSPRREENSSELSPFSRVAGWWRGVWVWCNSRHCSSSSTPNLHGAHRDTRPAYSREPGAVSGWCNPALCVTQTCSRSWTLPKTPHTSSSAKWPFFFQQISSEDNLFRKDPCKSVKTLVSSSYMETLPTSPNILQNHQTSETCLHYTQRITTS